MDTPEGTGTPTTWEPTEFPIDARGRVVVPEGYDPDISHLIMEDNRPVDGFFNEKQHRALTEPLYASWPGPGEGRSFLAMANVGLFPLPKNPPLEPDVMLSLDVTVQADLFARENKSYLVWVMKKVPEVVIEFVSDRRGDEDSYKLRQYARIKIPYYVVFDPNDLLDGGVLRVFKLEDQQYVALPAPFYFPELGLGVTLWEGEFEGHRDTWLRWCDREGKVIPTGRERAEAERQRADAAKQQADAAKQQADAAKQQADAAKQQADSAKQQAEKAQLRAEAERERADTAAQQVDQLKARLRELGVDPDA